MKRVGGDIELSTLGTSSKVLFMGFMGFMRFIIGTGGVFFGFGRVSERQESERDVSGWR